MDRRTFLAACGVAFAPAVSGCAGYTVASEEDASERRNRIDELEAEVEDLEAALDERESTIDELERDGQSLEAALDERETTIEDLETEADALRDDLEAAQEERGDRERDLLVSWYELAYGIADEAYETWNAAVTEFNRGEYARAEVLFGRADGGFESAARVVSTLEAACAESGYDDAVATTAEFTTILEDVRSAAEHFAAAANHYRRGNTDDGDRRLDEGRQYYDSDARDEIAEPEAFESTLE